MISFGCTEAPSGVTVPGVREVSEAVSLPPTSPDGPRDEGEPLRFDAAEGHGLDVLARLLGASDVGMALQGVTLADPHPALLEAGAQRIARACVAWLTVDDGWRERAVLRDGTRARGRLWDAHLTGDFSLRFTAAPRDFWLRAARVLPELSSLDSAAAKPARRLSRLLSTLDGADRRAAGDVVFFAIVCDALRSFRLTAVDEGALVRGLCAASPLASLQRPDATVSRDELRARFAALLDPACVRAVECVGGRLVARWNRAFEDTLRTTAPAPEQTARWRALADTLHAWLDTLDGALRMDLSDALARHAAWVFNGPFNGGVEAARAAVAASVRLRDLTERDALLAAVSDVCGLYARLLKRRDALALERYGDDRYDEAQAFVREADRWLTPLRARVDGVARAFAPVIA